MKRLAETRTTTLAHIGRIDPTFDRTMEGGQLVATSWLAHDAVSPTVAPFPSHTDRDVADVAKACSTLRQIMTKLSIWDADSFGSATPYAGEPTEAIALLDKLSARGKTLSWELPSGGVTIRCIPAREGRMIIAPFVVRRIIGRTLLPTIGIEALPGVEVRHIAGGTEALNKERVLEILEGRILTDEEAFGTPPEWSNEDRLRTLRMASDAIMVMPAYRRELDAGLDFNIDVKSETPNSPATASIGASGVRGVLMSSYSRRAETDLKSPSDLARAVICAIGRLSRFKGHNRPGALSATMPHWLASCPITAHHEEHVLFEAVTSATLTAARKRAFAKEGGFTAAKERLVAFLSKDEPAAAQIVAGTEPQ